MKRTMTRSEAQVMQAGSCYRQRQRAREVLARAERDLANFRELLGYPASSRQRQKYVRAARDAARHWWLAILDWQEACWRCSALPQVDGVSTSYILPRWELYIKRQRLLDLRQNDSDPGVMA